MRVPSVIPHSTKDFDQICKTFRCDVPEYLNMGYDMCDKHADEPSKVALLLEDDEGKEDVTKETEEQGRDNISLLLFSLNALKFASSGPC